MQWNLTGDEYHVEELRLPPEDDPRYSNPKDVPYANSKPRLTKPKEENPHFGRTMQPPGLRQPGPAPY